MDVKLENLINVSFSIKEMLSKNFAYQKNITREEILDKVLHKPITQNGKAIGVITDADDDFIYGIIYKGYEFELYDNGDITVELVDYKQRGFK